VAVATVAVRGSADGSGGESGGGESEGGSGGDRTATGANVVRTGDREASSARLMVSAAVVTTAVQSSVGLATSRADDGGVVAVVPGDERAEAATDAEHRDGEVALRVVRGRGEGVAAEARGDGPAEGGGIRAASDAGTERIAQRDALTGLRARGDRYEGDGSQERYAHRAERIMQAQGVAYLPRR
jgi:hypothetical protein